MELKDIIVKRRKELGMTQKELGAMLHVTFQTISKWENGKSLPDMSMLEPLAKALEISLIELLGGEANEAVVNTIDYSKKKISKTRFHLKLTTLLCIVLSIILSIIMLSKISFKPMNRIESVKLTGKAKEALGLVVGQDNYQIFEYRVDESFDSFIIRGWQNIDGTVTEFIGLSANGLHYEGAPKGQKLILSDMGNYQIKVNSGGAVTMSEDLADSPLLEDTSGFVTNFEWLKKSTRIVEGKPILLMKRTSDICRYTQGLEWSKENGVECNEGLYTKLEQQIYIYFFKNKTNGELTNILDNLPSPW